MPGRKSIMSAGRNGEHVSSQIGQEGSSVGICYVRMRSSGHDPSPGMGPDLVCRLQGGAHATPPLKRWRCKPSMALVCIA